MPKKLPSFLIIIEHYIKTYASAAHSSTVREVT